MASYYVWSAAAGAANGTSWTNAYTTLTAAFSGHAAGDVYYVAHDHAESTAGAVTLTSNGTTTSPTKIICVDRGGSVPPVSADRRATATVSTTGSNALTLASSSHYDGIILTAGNAAATTNLAPINTGTGFARFDNCSLRLGGTGASNRIVMTQGSSLVELNNTTVSFAAVGHGFTVSGGLRWRNTVSALLGTVPTTLFNATTGGASIECIGVDLSAAGSGKTICGTNVNVQSQRFKIVDCKLNAAVTKAATLTGPDTTEVDFIRSGSSGVNYTIYRTRMTGTLDHETTIVRTSGGATDGVTPISWKVVTTTICTYSMPFDCPPIAIWNDTTGSAKTATIECIASAIMTDQECWLELEYLGDASSPQGSFVNDGTANLLTTAVNQTSSSATWGGSTTAFKLNVTFTAQQKGWIYARVKVGKASSTVYVDPLITLT